MALCAVKTPDGIEYVRPDAVQRIFARENAPGAVFLVMDTGDTLRVLVDPQTPVEASLDGVANLLLSAHAEYTAAVALNTRARLQAGPARNRPALVVPELVVK